MTATLMSSMGFASLGVVALVGRIGVVMMMLGLSVTADAKAPKDPCRGKATVDAATGDTVVEHRDYWDTWAIRHDGEGTTFDVGVLRSGVHRRGLPKGHGLELRLEDGTAMVLKTVRPSTPVPSSNSYGARTLWTLSFVPTSEQVRRLARQRILSVHTTLLSGGFDLKLDAALSRRVQPAFACVEQHR